MKKINLEKNLANIVITGAFIYAMAGLFSGCYSEEYKKKRADLANQPHKKGAVVARDDQFNLRVFIDNNGDGIADKELVHEGDGKWQPSKTAKLWLSMAMVGDTIEYKAINYEPRKIFVVDKYVRINGKNIQQLDSIVEAKNFQQRVQNFQQKVR